MRARRRPIHPGVSIGHVDVTAGTAGLWVRDNETGLGRLLSNAHVVADTNKGATGDRVMQPGRADEGLVPADVFGALSRHVVINMGEEAPVEPLPPVDPPPPPPPPDPDPDPEPDEDELKRGRMLQSIINVETYQLSQDWAEFLKPGERFTVGIKTTPANLAAIRGDVAPQPMGHIQEHKGLIDEPIPQPWPNYVDAALVAPFRDTDIAIEHPEVELKQNVTPELGVQVLKLGRTTGLTTGVIEQVDLAVKVSYRDQGVARFQRQFLVRGETQPFSAAGDSGSLVVGADGSVIGLLFAGSPGITICNPIGPVFQLLNVTRFS